MVEYIPVKDIDKYFSKIELKLTNEIYQIKKVFDNVYEGYDECGMNIISSTTNPVFKKKINALLNHTWDKVNLKDNSGRDKLNKNYDDIDINKVYRLLRALDPNKSDTQFIVMDADDAHFMFKKFNIESYKTEYDMVSRNIRNKSKTRSRVKIIVDGRQEYYYAGIVETILYYDNIVTDFNKNKNGQMKTVTINLVHPRYVEIKYDMDYGKGYIGSYVEKYHRYTNGRFRLTNINGIIVGDGVSVLNRYECKNVECKRPLSYARSLKLY